MTPAQVRREVKKCQSKIKELKNLLAISEYSLKNVQDNCPHKNVREWTHCCYDGSTDYYWTCDDCGLMRNR